MSLSKGRWRLRLMANRDLVDTTWINAGDGELLETTLSTYDQLIDANPGMAWEAEIYDPDAPEDQAYIRMTRAKNGSEGGQS